MALVLKTSGRKSSWVRIPSPPPRIAHRARGKHMKQENRLTGNFGEGLAVNLLKEKGFEIVERNFSTRFGEIDIIARKDGVLVFVEVKTKKGDDFGTPEEMVGKGKVFRVKRMAEVYLSGKEMACRIDMVAVVLDSQNRVERITHYENLY